MAPDTNSGGGRGDPLAGVPLLDERAVTAGERWIYSAGFNVDPALTSTGRIDSELADLRRLADAGARVAVLSHQGSHRDGSAGSLAHVAAHLSRRLGRRVPYVPENASAAAVHAAEQLGPGDIALFGNTRHHAGEERGSDELARAFALLGDRVAVGGFSKAHRAHASNTGLLRRLPGHAAGSLAAEVRFLSPWADRGDGATRAAVLGGRKPEKTLVGLVHARRTCDLVVPGGVVLNTLLRAAGHQVGASDLGSRPAACLDAARAVLGERGPGRLHLPRTVWAAPLADGKLAGEARPFAVTDGVPADHAVVDFDVEPWALELLARVDRAVLAGTPSRYLDGHTRSSGALLSALSGPGGRALLLGGDTVSELPWSGPVSTGGGSALELLATGTCAVLDALRANAGTAPRSTTRPATRRTTRRTTEGAGRMELDLAVPTRVEFGHGAFDRSGSHARTLGGHALLVTGRRAARAHGYLGRMVASLESAGVRVTVYDRVSANPTSDEVDEAGALARSQGCDLVVGLGGGSALDAAKGVCVTAPLDGTVRDLIGTTLEPGAPALPLLAVPTTAGSGSEVTKGAIVTDTARCFRAGIRGDVLFPRIAVVDPDLIASLPRGLLAESAFDAFAHAVEGCVATRADAASRARAHQAIGLIARHLPAALRGETSPGTRAALSRAALLGGVNVANVSTCLPHRLQQAMGSVPRVDLSHGAGLAILYPSWLRHTAPLAPEAFAEVAELLGGATIHEAVGRLLASAGLPVRLRDRGVRKEDLDRFVEGVTGNLDNDPAGQVGRDRLYTLYAESY
ncbi:phosphoglycerate kinase [Streptomyces sp. SBT349]|uniref:phosphoglycerate kinase n=1 Tax=Streptomyces sp. SBT349 TaxID=1580539 RepID=UPI00099D6B20|nr:phosphoglycerate kinase [Streptomyces sp. SBT349]